MYYWVTSDYHLGHHNIIEYCGRPFTDADDMNRSIIFNHNERVKPEDTVFHLGDFCFTRNSISWEEALNGKIIHVRGNHDDNNNTKTMIEKVQLYFGGYNIIMSHVPDHALAPHFTVNVHGHLHNNKPAIWYDNNNLFINVSCDVHNFKPIRLDELVGMADKELQGGMTIEL